MSFAGKDLALRCCRNAFQQAFRDTRRLRLMRQISTHPSSPVQYSPRPITSPRQSLCLSHIKSLPSSTRPFTTSNRQAAKAIVNPRKDEDGKEMIIEITPRASHRLHAIATGDSNPSLCLRVAVESGGCHGFQYLMSLTSTDDISPDEDTLFESEDGKGAKVVMDEPSLELLKGSKIDYTMELIGSQFKVTGIPGATSSCGCGSSFDIQA